MTAHTDCELLVLDERVLENVLKAHPELAKQVGVDVSVVSAASTYLLCLSERQCDTVINTTVSVHQIGATAIGHELHQKNPEMGTKARKGAFYVALGC